jgi:hypothetical protein
MLPFTSNKIPLYLLGLVLILYQIPEITHNRSLQVEPSNPKDSGILENNIQNGIQP